MSYPRTPLLIKGALVEFSERFLGPIPNVIVFQYNPETLSRTLEAHTPAGSESGGGEEPEPGTAAPFDPEESFTLNLELDATDDLEQPQDHPVAVISGVAARISALEMLMYPQEGSLLGNLLGSVTASLGGASAEVGAGAEAEPVPRGIVPVVLFVWGPGRIVPVRLSSFSVEEQAYSPILYPTRAKVSVGLKVMSLSDLASYPDGIPKDLAVASYKFTKTQKQALAAANLANAVESILGMLPI